MAKDQKLNFGDDIASQLRTARKKRFSVQEEKRIAQEIELQSYLNKLIREDKENQIAKLTESEDIDSESMKYKIHEIEDKCVSINYCKIVVNWHLYLFFFALNWLLSCSVIYNKIVVLSQHNCCVVN